jgi:hypothetical protein
MKIKLLNSFLAATVMLVADWTAAAQSTNQLHFPLAGFTIAALDESPSASPQQALMMFLPTADGFAANVNVQIQPYAGTMDDYIALTLEQLKSADFKLLQKKVSGKAIAVFDYTGKMQGRALHWYARAEKSGARVYLVTASATDEQWNKVATRLKACVDSFRCDGGEQGAAPTATAPRR